MAYPQLQAPVHVKADVPCYNIVFFHCIVFGPQSKKPIPPGYRIKYNAKKWEIYTCCRRYVTVSFY